MFTKVVVIALVALCCAQALAAPQELRKGKGDLFKCMKDAIDVYHLIKDNAPQIFQEYHAIIDKAFEAKAKCVEQSDAMKTDEDKAAVMKQCTEQWHQEISQLNAAQFEKVLVQAEAIWAIAKEMPEICTV